MCRPEDYPPYDSPSLEDETSEELLALDREAFLTESQVIAARTHATPEELEEIAKERPLTEWEKEDLRDAIEFDLL